jgi:glycosyltransferase involved in cell wall biosynthesis
MPSLKFVLVGNGPMLEDMKLKYPDFIYAGVRTGEDLAAHYASADIFLFPSETETFGNVVLEAMASGLGVLAYDYAAARIHIKPKENGMLAALGNEEEFLQRAEQLLQNSVLLRKIRVNARQYTHDHTWDAIVERFIQVMGIYPDHTHFERLEQKSDLSNVV